MRGLWTAICTVTPQGPSTVIRPFGNPCIKTTAYVALVIHSVDKLLVDKKPKTPLEKAGYMNETVRSIEIRK